MTIAHSLFVGLIKKQFYENKKPIVNAYWISLRYEHLYFRMGSVYTFYKKAQKINISLIENIKKAQV